MQQGITKWNVTTKDEADSCYTPNLSIPSKVGGQTVKIIGAFVFQYSELKHVKIPPGVTTIETHAFANNQLTSVAIPSSVTTIGHYAFAYNNPNTITLQGRTSTTGMTLGIDWNGLGTVVFAP